MKTTTLIEMTTYDVSHHQAIQALLNQLTSKPMVLSEEALRRTIDDSASRLFLLLCDREVAGMLTLGIYPSPTGLKGWIEDVVVEHHYRGMGYGKQLVEHAIREARKAGVEQLMLTSNPLRLAANALYPKMGFQPKATNCYKMEL